MSETLRELPVPSSYGEVISALEQIVPTHMEWEVDDYEERGTLAFDGSVRHFLLPMGLTNELGLGNVVRCRVIGSVEEGMGIAFLVRPKNPFNRNVQGFYLQPAKRESGGPDLLDKARGYEVWQGKASWPKRNGAYWGRELLDDNAHLADPLITESFIETIQKHAQHKK